MFEIDLFTHTLDTVDISAATFLLSTRVFTRNKLFFFFCLFVLFEMVLKIARYDIDCYSTQQEEYFKINLSAPNLNPIEHLWDELGPVGRERISHLGHTDCRLCLRCVYLLYIDLPLDKVHCSRN